MSQQVEFKPDHGLYIEKDIKIIYLFLSLKKDNLFIFLLGYDTNLSVRTFIE